jgi:hypothetical protein
MKAFRIRFRMIIRTTCDFINNRLQKRIISFVLKTETAGVSETSEINPPLRGVIIQ